MRARFAGLDTSTDVARLLEIPVKTLTYYAYRNREYRTFEIRKRRGGTRVISAPATNLSILQAKITYILRLVYKTREQYTVLQ